MTLKQKIKPLIGSFRLWLLSNNFWVVSWFYRYIWKPKSDSFGEVLENFAKSHPTVFFVQVGGNDGFQNDPLYKFVKKNRWKGIVLEPQNKAFENLTKLYKKDPVIPVNKALSDNDEPQKLYKVAFCEDRWATGLSSFIRSHLEARVKDGYIDNKCREKGIQPPADKADYIKAVEVACTSFSSLFSKHNVSQVDLLHIDTEGFDYEVIRLFDFDRFAPKLIAFEHIHLTDSDKKECMQYLKNIGYNLTVQDMDIIAQKQT